MRGNGRASYKLFDSTLMPLAALTAVVEGAAGILLKMLWTVEVYVRRELARMAKFGVAGGTGYLIHLGVLAGLTSGAGMFYLASAGIASVGNISWNFTVNELWTFRDRRRSQVARRYARYFALMLATGALYFGLLWAFTDVLGLHYMVSAVVALAVQICVNFVVSFGWVWRKA